MSGLPVGNNHAKDGHSIRHVFGFDFFHTVKKVLQLLCTFENVFNLLLLSLLSLPCLFLNVIIIEHLENGIHAVTSFFPVTYS